MKYGIFSKRVTVSKRTRCLCDRSNLTVSRPSIPGASAVIGFVSILSDNSTVAVSWQPVLRCPLPAVSARFSSNGVRTIVRAAANEPDEVSQSSSSIYNYNVERSMRQIADIEKQRALSSQLRKQHKERMTWGMIAYQYYNWRKDTGSDILLIVGAALLALLGLGVGNFAINVVQGAQLPTASSLWESTYEVAELFFQDGFPDGADGNTAKQLYSVFVATTGLVFFTVLLAMVEQRFMEVLETNVQRGSPVYEEGHILILAWLESALSLNAVWKILLELCDAYRHEGGVRIVVLSDKPKLEMEESFQRFVPESKRQGSSFVFRQGSPLVPESLENVAASRARTTIVVSDQARSSMEADAQALRAAVLLDEMKSGPGGHGNVIVELQSGVTAQLMRNVCSDSVVPLSTYNLNSVRLAQLVQRPISALVNGSMMKFRGSSQLFVHSFPELVGTAFERLKYHFPSATVVGLLNVDASTCSWMPKGAVVVPGDEIILLRPTDCAHSSFRPLSMPLTPDMSSSWVDVIAKDSYEERLAVLKSAVSKSRALPLSPSKSAVADPMPRPLRQMCLLAPSIPSSSLSSPRVSLPHFLSPVSVFNLSFPPSLPPSLFLSISLSICTHTHSLYLSLSDCPAFSRPPRLPPRLPSLSPLLLSRPSEV
uniref:Ion channel dmi1-like chloroplastic n=1 Tax=Tetraselmis sp. GSL018 TaxID=582737 RepID=A0A061QST8_9CHLO